MNKAKEVAKSVLSAGVAVSAILAVLLVLSPIVFYFIKAEVALWNLIF